MHSPFFNPSVPSITQFSALCKEGRIKEILIILLTKSDPPIKSISYFQLLQICIAKKALPEEVCCVLVKFSTT
ncbi:hypothetical protein SUGI_0338530 [Cryptomeria japonica]|nr:hypothetical protein SUGI_0338530 [Cryptomeria japonica]